MYGLSAREAAVAAWLAMVVIFSMLHPSTRKSAASAVRSLFQSKLVGTFVLLSAYAVVCVATLYSLGIWETTDLKETVLWFLFSGIVLCFNALEKAREPGYLKQAIIAQLRALVVWEWLVNFHSFPFIVELIFFPVLAFLTMMQVFASAAEDQQTQRAGTVIGVVLGVIVLGLGVHSLLRAYSEFSPSIAADAFKAIVLPLLLTASLLPAVWAMGIWGVYERLAVRMGLRRGIPWGRGKAWRILWFNRLNAARTHVFVKRYSWELMQVTSSADLRRVFGKAVRGELGEAEQD